MSNKKFYFSLILIFTISALLLGFSYSKNSNDGGDELIVFQDKDDTFKVVYSQKNDLDRSNSNIDFGISNMVDELIDYQIDLIRMDEGTSGIYYSIDGSPERPVDDKPIFVGTLRNKGTDGDYALHNLRINGKDEFKVKIVVRKLVKKTFVDILKTNEGFKEKNGTYRFVGENVNNYIRYDNSLYRIVGLFDNKLMLISDAYEVGIFNASKNYLNVNDYLASFSEEVNRDNVKDYKSWLTIDMRYWLDSDEENGLVVDDGVGIGSDSKYLIHYQRYVINIDSNVSGYSGDGSLDNPYEVSYGS